jgi:hypothetical protein
MTRTSKGVLRARESDQHLRVAEGGRPVEIVDVRQRFGGIDIGASIAGALAALGVTVLLGGIAGSIGTVGYQLDAERGTDTLSIGGLAAGLVILVAAFLIGGWVAGRIARYDGGKNGLLTAVWFIALAAVVAGAGAWLGDKYDVFGDLRVPQWFSSNATTTAAIITGVIAAAVMLAAGFFGGTIGARYHERADEYLAAEERDLLTHDEPMEVVDHRGRVVTNQDRDDGIDLRDRTRVARSSEDVDVLDGVDMGTTSSRSRSTRSTVPTESARNVDSLRDLER